MTLNLHLENLKYSLFLKRRFLPIFLATCLGAFNDNLLRSGLVVLIAYSASKGIALPTKPEILVTLCSALLVLPMFLFSSIAGPLADKYEKSRLVVYAKVAEVFIMIGVYLGFAANHIMLLMCLLFVSGLHTTFYGPIKYSILPDHLGSGELLAGNGFMAGGSYLATLFGLIAGGLLVEIPGNIIGLAAIGIALLGLIASWCIPISKAAHPETHISFNIIKGSREIIGHAARDRSVLATIFGLSWFLVIGSVYMSQFPNYAGSVVYANNEVYILFLTVFSIGIAFGSVLCDTLLKGKISTKLMPFAAMGTSIFTYVMVLTTPKPAHEGLLDVSAFLLVPSHWPVLGCMLMVAVCAGVYMVPLYAVIQTRTDPQYRSRVLAASNFSDSVFMTLAAMVCAVLLSMGFTILDLFTLVATVNLVVVWYAHKYRKFST